MWDIFKSLLNKFKKQFIPMKKSKEIYPPKWINGKIKIVLRETKIAHQIHNTISSEENHQRYRQPLQSKKGETRKSKRLCEIESANSIKDSKKFLKYFSNNKKQKSSIGPLHKKGDMITGDIEIAKILTPSLLMSYNMSLRAPMV